MLPRRKNEARKLTRPLLSVHGDTERACARPWSAGPGRCGQGRWGPDAIPPRPLRVTEVMTDVTIHCRRCQKDAAPLARAPFKTELGERIVREICGACWQEWLKQQTQ